MSKDFKQREIEISKTDSLESFLAEAEKIIKHYHRMIDDFNKIKLYTVDTKLIKIKELSKVLRNKLNEAIDKFEIGDDETLSGNARENCEKYVEQFEEYINNYEVKYYN